MVSRVHSSSLHLSQLFQQSSSSLSSNIPSKPQKATLLVRWVTYEKEVFIPLYLSILSLSSLSSSSSSLPHTCEQVLSILANNNSLEENLHPIILHTLSEWGKKSGVNYPSSWKIDDLSLFFLTSL